VRIKSVGFDNFEQETLKNENAAILLCMNRGRGFSNQAEALCAAAKAFSERLVPLVLDEDFVEPFRLRYGIKGTPTFLIFLGGMEKGRLLGQHGQETLRRFVEESLGPSTARSRVSDPMDEPEI